jgi:catechol 2,3-dioxygenase-like lactoylglutathione lyase family enzyme
MPGGIVSRFEVGIVAADRGVVDFLADVFGLEELPATQIRVGTLHRLRSPGAVIKVMVPSEPPKPADGEPFLAVSGFRYLSLWITDLDGVLRRATARGGTLVFGPAEHGPGSRLAVIQDPYGNTLEVIEAATSP